MGNTYRRMGLVGEGSTTRALKNPFGDDVSAMVWTEFDKFVFFATISSLRIKQLEILGRNRLTHVLYGE